MSTPSSLNRTLSLWAMVFYGLGTIVGAGIYVLIGEVVAQAGAWAPLSFVIAAIIASFTGLSYAELVGRYPQSAGEAVYVQAAFRRPWLTQLVGWAVVLTGLVSGATLLKGFSGYFVSLLGGEEVWIITGTMVLMCIIACSGVKQSVGVAVAITFIELSGLLLVVLVAGEPALDSAQWEQWFTALENPPWTGIAAAAFLAFYAFIGFEDMVNMAEEVQDATRTLPRAIIIAIAASASVYLLVAMVAVLVVPLSELAQSRAPMVTMVSQIQWFPASLLLVISLIAIVNGAIVQLLMAPRVIYGLSRDSNRLKILSFIHPKTQTPVVATVLVSALILFFSLGLPLARLAQLTSAIILLLFILINLALIVIKKREAHYGFTVSIWVPVTGALTSFLLFVGQFFIG